MSKSVLVLGGSIFVGRSLVENLLEADYDVTLLNRGTRPVPGTAQRIADRQDQKALGAAVGSSGFDFVIDSCCYTASEARIAYDVLGASCRTWIQIGSAAVYRDDAPVPTPERGYLGDSAQWGGYGRDKLAAEEALASAAEASGGVAVVLRAPYIYGPGNTPEREAWLWERLLQRRPVLIPGDGSTPLQWLHTWDLWRAVSAVMKGWSQPGLARFNVAERAGHSIRSYLETLAEVAGVEAQLRETPYEALGLAPRGFFPFRDTSMVLDVGAIHDALGWQAELDLRSGLERTLRAIGASELASAPLDTRVEDEILERIS